MKATVISLDVSPARQRAMKEAVTRNGFEIRSTRVIREPVDLPPLHLTPRQLEVLSLLCEGLPNKLISRQLNISGATVKVHVGCILRELGVSSRLQAVVAAPRLGLVNESTADISAQGDQSTPAGQPVMLRMFSDEARRAHIDAYQRAS